MAEQELGEEFDEQVINDEYKTWKKNSPYLYDLMISRALQWPSLTVDWLPNKDWVGDYSVQKIAIGTHTNRSEQDMIRICNVKIPIDDIKMLDKSTRDRLRDTEDKIEPHILINHENEPNKIRCMPQNGEILASKTQSGEVHLFDYTKHPSKSNDPPNPQMRLTGHKKEGYGLAWSSVNSGILASGSDDHLVCIWDTNHSCEPFMTLNSHTSVVNDVAWNISSSANLLASVGDDKKIFFWDTRQNEPMQCIDAHNYEINTVDFNKCNEYLLATGSADKTVKIWDYRNMAQKLASLEYHKDAVHDVRWAPFNGIYLASSGDDRRICLWDISRLADTGEAVEEEVPSTLIFLHGGHTAGITDINWNSNDQMVLASTAEDNIVQVWQMNFALLTSDMVILNEAMDIEQ